MELVGSKKLQADTWFSVREARELIFGFIRWGDHRHDDLRHLSDAEVAALLVQRGFDFGKVVDELQANPHRAIPLFENLLDGGTWEITASPGGQVKHSHLVDGVVVSERDVKEHAVFRISHIADFSAACEARDRAILNTSFDDFYTALSKGIASLEAYFALRVAVHNGKCSVSERLVEKRPKGGFVSFETKLRKWLPKMAETGINFDASPSWNDFTYLRQIRNDVVTHPKPDAGLETIEDLALAINRFRSGVAGLMAFLHQIFGERIPSSVIRATRYPQVRVVQRG